MHSSSIQDLLPHKISVAMATFVFTDNIQCDSLFCPPTRPIDFQSCQLLGHNRRVVPMPLIVDGILQLMQNAKTVLVHPTFQVGPQEKTSTGVKSCEWWAQKWNFFPDDHSVSENIM